MIVNVTKLLDDNRISRFQVLVFVFCALIALLDGYDTLVIGFTAQPIAASLHVSIATFGPIFAAVQIGFMVGAFIFAPLGDRLGRKPVLIAGVLVFAIGSLLVVNIGSLTELLTLRLLTGVGLGIANPLFVSLGADYAPTRLRGTVVTLFWIGIPLGGVFGGILGSVLINDYGWQSLYWIGGLTPLPIALLLVFALPESLTLLVTQNKHPAKIKAIIRKIAPALALDQVTSFVASEPKLPGIPVKHLFRQGEAVTTLLLWCAFFADFFVLYATNTWPAALLKAEGVPPSQAALITSFYGGGGIIGTLVVGYLVDRLGTIRALCAGAVLGTLSTAAIGFVSHSFAASCATFLIAGIMIGGVGVGLVVLATKAYPTPIRSTGVGWALGVARMSGILAPLTIGVLVAQGWNIRGVFVACAGPALLAGMFAALLQLWQSRRELPEDAKAVAPVA